MRVIKFILSTIILAGCAGAKINDLDYSLVDIQKGITNTAPKGIGSISPNRRTFTTKYFDPETIKADRSTEKGDDVDRERAYVVYTILGDRRPYDVEIDVYVEEDSSGKPAKKDDDFIDGKWSKTGSDKSLAKFYQERLANYLARLERNKNLIDDFRPF
jgi:hypothetical protein